MDLETFNHYCLSKKGVTASYPFKGETVWMKVAGKMFAMANVQEMMKDGELIPSFHFVNLKCDPQKAEELRTSHHAIQPGWHQNKTHWNSLYMDGSLNDHLIFELIDHSYNIVFDSLSNKVKEELSSL